MVAEQTAGNKRATDKKNDKEADKKDRYLYRNKYTALPLTQLTCKPTMSLRLVSCGHQPYSILACHTLVPCCTVAHPQSLCTFQARSASSQDFQTITLITRSGMLVLLCLQHCNQQWMHTLLITVVNLQHTNTQHQIVKIIYLCSIRSQRFRTINIKCYHFTRSLAS